MLKLLPCIPLIVFLFSCSREQKPDVHADAALEALELPGDFKLDAGERKVFPYSIVPGGTVNRSEVKDKVARDPIVREHYKGILIDKLKPFRLTKPFQGYVSYRIGSHIFWTSRRLYLKAGEILLSDGIHMIRGRCGNLVSRLPLAPMQRFGEPTERVFDIPSWDNPIFQAMAQQTKEQDLRPQLFSLPGNGPEPVLTIAAKIPESYFTVAPPVIGPGMIGGSLPGGLPPPGKGGEIIINNSPFIYIFSQPLNIPPPGILLPSITPVEVALNQLPPNFINGAPIGIGSHIFYFIDNPLPPVLFIPPVYFAPPIVISGPTPPSIFIPPGVVVPPVIVTPGGPPVGPPVGPPAGPPGETPGPPQTEPPPAFQPIPEPATLGMVALAAALIYLLKRTPSLRPVPCRSLGGRPLR